MKTKRGRSFLVFYEETIAKPDLVVDEVIFKKLLDELGYDWKMKDETKCDSCTRPISVSENTAFISKYDPKKLVCKNCFNEERRI
jgi:hypothetical protein